MSRLNGETLEEIGSKYGITRERVRQIVVKHFKKFPTLRENKFAYYMQHYDLSLNDFTEIFKEPKTTYYYLKSLDRIERKPLDEAFDDDLIPDKIKLEFEKVYFKNYLSIDGLRIRKRRPEIAYYVVKKYCQESTQFDEFLNYYDNFIFKNGLGEEFKIADRTYENRLANCSYVLWSTGRTFRYYNIESRDLTELYEVLNLNIFKNVVISVYKLYCENSEIMKKFDIRNENELHNLLKKSYKQYVNGLDIVFGRMPTIGFGSYNQDEQVFELMLQNAPIEMYDFCDLYEEVYGVKSGTVLGSYLGIIRPYLSNGVYRIDEKPMDYSMLNHIKSMLNEVVYTIDEVKEIFKKEYPNDKEELINSYNLKNLGYRVYSGYVLKDKYQNVTEYLDYLFANNLNEEIQKIKTKLNTTYSNYVLRAKTMRKIVEYEPDCFINIDSLNRNGVFVKDLEDFCESAKRYIKKGDFFTIISLRNDGFSHYLDDLGFGDYFYSSILIEDPTFTYRRVGGDKKLLYYGEQMIELKDLIVSIISDKKKMNIYDLLEYIIKKFDIHIEKSKALSMIKDTDLFYSQIMECVYIDYNTYYKEI